MQNSHLYELTSDLKDKILNDPILKSKKDVQNISAVCRAFKEIKNVPKWHIREDPPIDIFMRAAQRKCTELKFGKCNLSEITVPVSLPASLKRLVLDYFAINTPPTLINIALS